MARRRSPSVMMPARRPASSTAPRQPKRFSVISSSARSIGVSDRASGTASPVCIRSRTRRSARAEPAARMDLVEVGRCEAPAGQQRHGDRVAECHLHGGRGGRGEAHRAGFRGGRQGERHIGGSGQRRAGAGGDRHEWQAEAAGVRDQVGEFCGLARIRQREHGVALNDHAQIAVRRFGWVDKQRRRPGGGECGRRSCGRPGRTCPCRRPPRGR